MVIVLILLAAIGIAVLILVLAKPGSRKGKEFQEALESYNNLLINEALKKFQALLYEEPYNSLYHWYLARCFLQKQEFTNAIYHLENVLQINNYSLPPEELPDVDTFNELGIHYRLLGIYETLKLRDKVMSEIETLMKLDPTNDEFPVKMAEFILEEKNYSDQTQGLLEKALNINPKNGKAQFLLALVYFKNGKFDEALQSAEKTITIDRTISDAYFIIGYVRYRLNQKEDAERNFRDAALCKYFRKSNAFYMAKLMLSSGKIDYALPYAADAGKFTASVHEDQSLELEARYLYATMLEQVDRFQEAMEIYKSIQNIQPDYQDVSKRLKYMSPIEDQTKAALKPGKGDILNYYKGLKLNDFARYSEKLMENLGYKIKKIDLINDQTINMLVYESGSDQGEMIGVFVRRGIGIIQEDHIKNIEHFMAGMQVKSAFLITPNDFNPNARKKAEKKGIRTINGENLREMLNNISI